MEPMTMAGAQQASSAALPWAEFGMDIATSAMNVHEVRQNRRFQRDMANTAHQREVKDLRAAGLNPILSVSKGGGGAPVPATSAPHIQSPQIQSKLLNSAQMQISNEQINLLRAQTRDVNSAAALKDAQAKDILDTKDARIEHLYAQISQAFESGELSVANYQKAIAEIKNLEVQRIHTREQTVGENLRAQHSANSLAESQREKEFHEGVGGKISPWLKNIIDRLPGIGGLIINKTKGSKSSRTERARYNSRGEYIGHEEIYQREGR